MGKNEMGLYFEELKKVVPALGIGTILALFIRPYYEFYYNRRKTGNDVKRIFKQLSSIPYALHADQEILKEISEKIKKNLTLSKLENKILSKELLSKLAMLDIPISRTTDYLNEATFFRVKTINRIMDKHEADFAKFLSLKNYKAFSFVSSLVKRAEEIIIKLENNNLSSKERIDLYKEFNQTMFAASNTKRNEKHILFLERWDLSIIEKEDEQFPVFKDKADFTSKSLRL